MLYLFGSLITFLALLFVLKKCVKNRPDFFYDRRGDLQEAIIPVTCIISILTILLWPLAIMVAMLCYPVYLIYKSGKPKQ